MADDAPAQAAPTPETASEIPATTPETAPVSTTTPVEAPIEGAGKVEGGVEGYLAEKEKALRGASAPAQAAPGTPPETPAAPPETPAAPATPPAAVAATPATPPETPPATPPETPPEEDKKPDRIRIGALKDGHLVAAATNIAREENISFEEAFERVKPKPAAAPSTPAEPATTGLRARADVEREIAETDAERDAAAEAGEKLEAGALTRAREAQKKFESLNKELGEIEKAELRAEQDRQQQEETAFGRTVSESKALAVEYWPDAGVAESEFSNRMIELSDLYEKDPKLAHHAYEADAPFFFAELVAKELKLLPAHLQKAAPAAPATPGTQPSTPPATKPAPVNQRAVLRPVQPAAGPASGAARTTAEAATDDPLGINKINSVASYEAVKAKALKKPSQERVPA